MLLLSRRVSPVPRSLLDGLHHLLLGDLQVLEAWCNKAITFAESGLCLRTGFDEHSGKNRPSPEGSDVDTDGMVQLKQSLSQVRVCCLWGFS